MFCSFCKRVDQEIREDTRKICRVGHIACETCAANLSGCSVCSEEFCSTVEIQLVNNVPRLIIADLLTPPNKPSEKEDQIPKSTSETDSFQQLMQQLNEYEERKKDQGSEIPSSDHPVLALFEVIGDTEVQKPPSSLSFSYDGEDEREIMECFKFSEKISKTQLQPNQEKSNERESSSTKKSIAKNFRLLTHREVQTSVTYVVEDGNSSSRQRSRDSSSCAVPSKLSGSLGISMSRDCYPIDEYDYDAETTINSETASVYEIFKNEKAVEDSEMAHFTSITVISGPSPPDSPQKKGIPSLACRVKFESSYNADGRILAQMEPLTIYIAESTESSEDLPSDRSRKLSRFPVLCPITSCETWSVPSDFCNHMTIDHPHIDVLKVVPGKLINMKVNHKGNLGQVMCQRLFLVTDKITDIGYGIFSNCLPITLLTSKLLLQKAFGCSKTNKSSSDEKFCLWLVGVYKFPISFTLSIFSHGRDPFEPTIIKCISNSVFCSNKPFTPKEIINNSIALTSQELQQLTDNGRKLLSCQILFH